MALFDRLSRVVRANLNEMVSQSANPEAVLDQAISDMQEALVQTKQAIAGIDAGLPPFKYVDINRLLKTQQIL